VKYFIALFFLYFNLGHTHATTGYHGGTFVPYFNKVQVNTSGETKTFELTPYLGISTQLNMSGPHYFVPELGYAHYLENAKKTQKSVFFLRYDFSYILSQKFILRYGLTNHWMRISGDGGTVTLRNGSRYTAFKAPSETKTSYFTTLDVGGEFFIKQNLSVRLDLNMMSFQNMENSGFNYLLTLNFYR
jgi:hypothetical protein